MIDNAITPPPELIREWIRESNHNEPMFAQVAVMGARWGAQQKQEECDQLKQRLQKLLNERG